MSGARFVTQPLGLGHPLFRGGCPGLRKRARCSADRLNAGSGRAAAALDAPLRDETKQRHAPPQRHHGCPGGRPRRVLRPERRAGAPVRHLQPAPHGFDRSVVRRRTARRARGPSAISTLAGPGGAPAIETTTTPASQTPQKISVSVSLSPKPVARARRCGRCLGLALSKPAGVRAIDRSDGSMGCVAAGCGGRIELRRLLACAADNKPLLARVREVRAAEAAAAPPSQKADADAATSAGKLDKRKQYAEAAPKSLRLDHPRERVAPSLDR